MTPEYGPGLLAGAISALGWWAIRRQHQRHTRRRGIQRLEAYANQPETRRLHDDTHNQPGKEKPQP